MLGAGVEAYKFPLAPGNFQQKNFWEKT
jgi:hypothetical protein